MSLITNIQSLCDQALQIKIDRNDAILFGNERGCLNILRPLFRGSKSKYNYYFLFEYCTLV